jgi:hypothetical protein
MKNIKKVGLQESSTGSRESKQYLESRAEALLCQSGFKHRPYLAFFAAVEVEN